MGVVHSLVKHLLSKATFVRIKEQNTKISPYIQSLANDEQDTAFSRYEGGCHWRKTDKLFFLKHFKKSNTFSQQHNAY